MHLILQPQRMQYCHTAILGEPDIRAKQIMPAQGKGPA